MVPASGVRIFIRHALQEDLGDISMIISVATAAVTVTQVLVMTERYAKISSEGGHAPVGVPENLSLSLKRMRRLMAFAARRAD